MDQLLVALDVERAADAERLAEQLHGLAGGFKIGSRLFTAEGPQFVRRLTSRGIRVFLDLKFHDIPNTVAGAATEAARLGVWMMTVHASGGGAMMQAAMGAARDAATKIGTSRPLIVGITVLTSLNPGDLAEVGVARDLRAQVAAMAVLAEKAGMDGVVASPLEVGMLRRQHPTKFLIVTPGIRGAERTATKDDQARVLSAAEALRDGASYLIVGRPIIRAADPRAAAEHLIASIGPEAQHSGHRDL